MSFIFLVDTSFVLFNNAPTNLLLQEMGQDLMSPAKCFEAESPSDCLDALRRLLPAGTFRSRLSFLQTVQLFQQNAFNEVTSSALLQLDSLNLFGILTGKLTIASNPPTVIKWRNLLSLLTMY